MATGPLASCCEEPHIATLFLEHNKCDDRAPAGHSLFTAYLEAEASEVCWGKSDDEIRAVLANPKTRSRVRALGYVSPTALRVLYGRDPFPFQTLNFPNGNGVNPGKWLIQQNEFRL